MEPLAEQRKAVKQADRGTRERLAPRADTEFSKRILQGSFLPFLLLLLVAVGTSYPQDHPRVLWTFGAAMAALGVARAYTGLIFRELYPQRPLLWRRLAKAGAYGSAVVWGAFAAVTFALHSQRETMWFTMLVTTGLAAGASVALAPYPSLAWHYILIVLAPSVVLALLDGSLWSYELAGMMLLYAVFLIGQSRNSARWFWRAVTQEEKEVARSRELEERTAYLKALIQESPLAIVVLDPAQNVRLCNPAFERLFQYRQEEIATRNLDELIRAPEAAEEAARLSQKALEGATVHETTRRRRKDGTLVDVELHAVPLLRDGQVVGLYAIYEDITSRRQAEIQVAEANRKLEQQVAELNQLTGEIHALSELGSFLQSCETVGEAYKVVARSARHLFAGGSGALYLVSPSKDTLEAVSLWGSLPSSDAPLVPQQCWALRMGQVHARTASGAEPLCGHAEGEEQAAMLCIPVIAQGEAMGVLHLRASADSDTAAWMASHKRLGTAFAKEVALAVANLNLREKLQAQSIRDPLTGLFNRRYMEESLERELRRATRAGSAVTVLMVDLDHFKQFNDTFGHEAGDLMLKELGRLLRQQVRGEDIVCRYGGEEFTVILPDTSPEDAMRRAEQLRQAVMQLEVRHRGQDLGELTLSIGAASFPLHATSAGALLRAADQALYTAKSSGRNRVVMAAKSRRTEQAGVTPLAS